MQLSKGLRCSQTATGPFCLEEETVLKQTGVEFVLWLESYSSFHTFMWSSCLHCPLTEHHHMVLIYLSCSGVSFSCEFRRVFTQVFWLFLWEPNTCLSIQFYTSGVYFLHIFFHSFIFSFPPVALLYLLILFLVKAVWKRKHFFHLFVIGLHLIDLGFRRQYFL